MSDKLTPQEQLAEEARRREARDLAWKAFLESPMWFDLRSGIEKLQHDAIQTLGRVGITAEDRCMTGAIVWVLAHFLSQPDLVLQRLALRATHGSPAPGDADQYRPPKATDPLGRLG